ncbi:MAG: GAF and ANTAR domain-containing protein [Candidatus Omnitrophota bacterium]|jgi:signal transduction protein with GAF and PtsI domain
MRYEEQIQALSRISIAISSGQYLDDILKLIVKITAEVINSNICSIMLLDEKKKLLMIKATQSISEEYNKKSPLKIGEGIAGKVVQLNKSIAVENVLKEKEYKYKDIARREKLCSLLCVPLAVNGAVIGVLNCYTSSAHKFSDTEINILTSIASQAAVAIENAQLASKSKMMQDELESRKIIERAKGILMRDQKISEEQSYMRLRKYSMDSRKSMREVAEAIILASDMQKAI